MEKLITELIARIEESEKIVIMRHKRPDLDAIGSQIALQKILQKLYPQKTIYAIGEEEFSKFAYLGECQKIKQAEFDQCLKITVDNARLDRLETDGLQINDELIKIDHHIVTENQNYGTLNLVDADCPSTTQLIYRIFRLHFTDFLNVESARALYAGLIGDTGNFSYPVTNSESFAMASELVKYDFNPRDINLKMVVMSSKLARVLGHGYENIEIIEGIGVIRFPKKIQKKYKVTASDIGGLANYFEIIEPLKVWIVLNEYDSFIRINARSREIYDVQRVCILFNGGGHKNASGGELKTWKDEGKLITEIKKMIEENERQL